VPALTTLKPVVDCVAGARPNFVKLAPVARAIAADGRLALRIVHTGQHYDPALSGVFFEQLRIPPPDVHLDVGSGPHGAQTGRILERYEAHLLHSPPAATVVFGDVNSTIACALAAAKLAVPVVHVEAGLRSFDRTMPEEINRLLTDAIAELLLASEHSGLDNLRREGVAEHKIRLVGNVMIDTLLENLAPARLRDVHRRLGLQKRGYGLITLHRPSNVDDPDVLASLLRLFHQLASSLPLVFPVHPRTLAASRAAGLGDLLQPKLPLLATDPLPYLDALALVAEARLVLTDSGGLQEECSVLGVPCLTLRTNTERPVTLTLGTSRLVGNDPTRIRDAFQHALDGSWKTSSTIPLWDGNAGRRVATEIADWIARRGSEVEGGGRER
jgi:UDP-N-acetylglucosamine 2-epimerase (non-hydrolysing)